MTKKIYMKPTMNVVHAQMSQMLCASGVNDNLGGDGFTIVGPGSGPARARSHGGDWDDWDE